MNTFCTIVTPDYIALARTLYRSLCQFNNKTTLTVLVTDYTDREIEQTLIFKNLTDIRSSGLFAEIEGKYAHTNPDFFRWALKPVLVGHLLKNGFSKVFFCDPDIYFVNNFDFLLDLSDKHSILLTPHWADLDIVKSEDCVQAILKNGLFNAGFVAASQDSLEAINWWASMCHYKMDKSQNYFNYVDQKYLDVLPAQFPGVHIIQHQGCNLASWNIQTCKRDMVDGKLLINKRFEPVFIHFAKGTILNILNRNDALLRPYLDEYISQLSANGFDLMKTLDDFSPTKYDTAFYKLKHRLRLRTRLKKFLYKLAEKL